MYTSLSSAILVFAALVAAAPRGSSDLKVKTPSGPVVGHYAKAGNYTGVREFLGIPYAKPPVGDLRFAPPQKHAPWKEPFNAEKFGPGCIQTPYETGLIRQAPPAVEDEDCLRINIWAPTKRRNPLGGATVMLWTHGGGFEWGTAETNIYNGANIVNNNHDVIVVSYNYRLNIFGFPAAPGLEDKALNPGLLDVRRAVEWVKENIAAFGGDPKKITLFGESAGGAAVDAYMYFAAKDPIIRGAISQSGVLSVNSSRSGPRVEPWTKLSTALDCPATPAEANLACIRGKSATAIRDAAASTNFTYGPAADNGTIFSDTTTRLARGEFARIPFLVGSNDQEIPGNTPQAKLSTRLGFTCPAARTAAGRTKYVPTWQYRYFGDFPTTVPPLAVGPYHGTEIPVIFQTYNPAIATPEQIAASKYIQGTWVAFAKNPKLGLSLKGWPTFKEGNSTTLVRLAYQNQVKADFANPLLYQAGC